MKRRSTAIKQGAAVDASQITLHQTEAQFQASVLRLAWARGWLAYHTRLSIGSNAGFPDLVLVRGERVLWRELKSARGTLTDDQIEWLERLHAAGQDAKLWRPGDWDEIEQELSA